MHDDAVLLLPLNIEGGREQSTLTQSLDVWISPYHSQVRYSLEYGVNFVNSYLNESQDQETGIKLDERTFLDEQIYIR